MREHKYICSAKKIKKQNLISYLPLRGKSSSVVLLVVLLQQVERLHPTKNLRKPRLVKCKEIMNSYILVNMLLKLDS